MIVLALLIGTTGGSDKAPKSLPALTPSAPPSNPAATAPCTKLLQKLPVRLNGLAPRTVHPVPDTPFVVAWGDPAIILRCGVARPKDLHPGSSTVFISGSNAGTLGPFYDVTSSGGTEIYTTVDRAVYIDIAIPSKYQGSTFLPIFSKAINAALPAICYGGQPGAGKLPPSEQLCSRRP